MATSTKDKILFTQKQLDDFGKKVDDGTIWNTAEQSAPKTAEQQRRDQINQKIASDVPNQPSEEELKLQNDVLEGKYSPQDIVKDAKFTPSNEEQIKAMPDKLQPKTIQEINDYFLRDRQEKDRKKDERRERRNKLFAAIGDGIYALSNLYFANKSGLSATRKPGEYLSDKLRERYDYLEKERLKLREQQARQAYLQQQAKDKHELDMFNANALKEYRENLIKNQQQRNETYDKNAGLREAYNQGKLDAEKRRLDIKEKENEDKNKYQQERNDIARMKANKPSGRGGGRSSGSRGKSSDGDGVETVTEKTDSYGRKTRTVRYKQPRNSHTNGGNNGSSSGGGKDYKHTRGLGI